MSGEVSVALDQAEPGQQITAGTFVIYTAGGGNAHVVMEVGNTRHDLTVSGEIIEVFSNPDMSMLAKGMAMARGLPALMAAMRTSGA